ncbi:MAG: hypothetical protein IJ792_04040 [Oscillospiraceae bacterium]|nr:hypothetical protein [Oscillospiraceae bacterium]
MLKLYSKKKAKQMIETYSDWITHVSEMHSIPEAYIKAILYKEIIEIDLFDPVADFAVKTYWARYGLRKRLYQKGLVKRAEPRFRHGILGKKDSSTGYAQIFAYVAINAANFGWDRGIATYDSLGIRSDHRLSGGNPDDLCMMWNLLSKDRKVNIALASLNLVSAAEEMNGHVDFDRYSEEEIKRTFTRYNANVRYITKYGEEAYRYYLGYSGQSAENNERLKRRPV